jgi:hypothetical protein
LGGLSITTTGAVYGKYNSGVAAKNYGASLTISAATVVSLAINAAGASGGVEGIGAYNHGSGSLTITTTGTVSGGSIYRLIGKGYQSGQGVTIQVTFWARANIWRDFIASPPAAIFATLSGLDPTTLDGALEGTWARSTPG